MGLRGLLTGAPVLLLKLLLQNMNPFQTPDIPVVPHQRLVVPDHLQGVLQLPAVAAVVLEASQGPAIVKI